MSSVFGPGGGVSPRTLKPAYGSGRFQLFFEGTVATSGAIPAIDVLYLYAFRVYSPIVVTSIFQRCQTLGAASAVKCAVWALSPTTGLPTGVPVLGQNAGFDTTGTGIRSEAIASVTLQPGVYAGGSKTTGTPPAMINVASTSLSGLFTSDSAANSAVMVGLSVASPYTDNIMTTDLTSASFSAVLTAGGIPIVGLGWA